jgi:hypothetical protein
MIGMKRSLAGIALLSLPGALARAGNWEQWRGPAFNGSAAEENLPVHDRRRGRPAVHTSRRPPLLRGQFMRYEPPVPRR